MTAANLLRRSVLITLLLNASTLLAMPPSTVMPPSTFDDRRGRWAVRWVFKTQVPGRPIKPIARANFLDALKAAFRRLRYKEAHDLVFRGEGILSKIIFIATYILSTPRCTYNCGYKRRGPAVRDAMRRADAEVCATPAWPRSCVRTPPTQTVRIIRAERNSGPAVGAGRAHVAMPACAKLGREIRPAGVATASAKNPRRASPSPLSPLTPTEPATPGPPAAAPELNPATPTPGQSFSPSVSASSPRGGLFGGETHDTTPTAVRTPLVSAIFPCDASRLRPSPSYFKTPPTASSSSDLDRVHGQREGEAASAPILAAASTSRQASSSAQASTSAVPMTAPPARLPLRLRRLDLWPHSGLRRSSRLGQKVVRRRTGYEPGLAPLHPQIILFEGGLRPLVDKNLVIGGIAGAPVGNPLGDVFADWNLLLDRGARDLARVHRNADFTHLPKFSDLFLRVGIDFGVRGAYPHPFVNTDHNKEQLRGLVLSDFFSLLAAHQNALLRQLAPRVYAYMRAQLDALEERHAIAPAFPGSAFSTAEFTFGNSLLHNCHSARDAIHSLRVITLLGNFETCICVIPADNLAIHCVPGTTVFIAGSVKNYYFTKVRANETRYLFQQYFDVIVQRYIDRGFRCDVKYEAEATEQEIAQVETNMVNRVAFTMKLLSRLHEIHV
ncbi:hypothetical protein C8F04DRAFT_1269679 [Mycena alexandri]|uniref:Uncharacterized protein n=1 Tax=Mycena alexandri TaxID=1745969 RepID=A0AAD6SC09_9AGAR|nr:hypothetical protein C8F04DRAFT_1269679 [Mycena alexandri]